MFSKLVERLCRWLAILFLVAVIISYRQEKYRTEEKILDLTNNTESNSGAVVYNDVEVLATKEGTSGEKVELKNSRENLERKENQFKWKNAMKVEPDDSTWILSYPGRYLKFPQNFEKVLLNSHIKCIDIKSCSCHLTKKIFI